MLGAPPFHTGQDPRASLLCVAGTEKYLSMNTNYSLTTFHEANEGKLDVIIWLVCRVILSGGERVRSLDLIGLSLNTIPAEESPQNSDHTMLPVR